MSRGAHAGLLLLFGLLLLGTTARAQPTAMHKKRAAELATESAKHYKRGEFEVSVALLRQAYALYPEPNLLYNLARSLEGMGDKRGAVDHYNKYLATAKRIDDRAAIEKRVAMLERELAGPSPKGTSANIVATTSDAATDTSKPEANPPKPEPSADVAPPKVTPAGPPDDMPLTDPFAPKPETVSPPSKLPLIPIGVGAAAVGAGIGFGLRARSFESSAMKEPVGLAASEAYADAVTNARIANVCFIAGGVVLAAGIVWEVFVLRAQSKKSDAVYGVRPAVSTRGIALEWTLP